MDDEDIIDAAYGEYSPEVMRAMYKSMLETKAHDLRRITGDHASAFGKGALFSVPLGLQDLAGLPNMAANAAGNAYLNRVGLDSQGQDLSPFPNISGDPMRERLGIPTDLRDTRAQAALAGEVIGLPGHMSLFGKMARGAARLPTQEGGGTKPIACLAA